MTRKKTILVVGATGAQGGSVASHLLAQGKFAVRCLTRNPNSERSVALSSRGAVVVPGDLADPASLRAALKGCYGVFGVTNYWEHFDREYQHGKNLVDAVASAKVGHFVFSTLPYVKKITNHELDVPHFDLKGRLEEFAHGLDLPATFIHCAFYYENFTSFFPPRRRADGSFSFGFPQGDTPLAAVAAEDIGGVVAALFAQPAEHLGKVVGIVGDDAPPAQYAEAMGRALSQPVTYEHVPREVFASLGFPGAGDLANMFEFNRRYVPNRRADLDESRALYPQIRTFETWLGGNRERFRAIFAATAQAHMPNG